MANMNMIIHDMEGQIEIGDTFKNPKFRSKGKLRTFDRVVANPMWNQDWFTEADYDNDELDRFPTGAGFPANPPPTGLGPAHARQPERQRPRRRRPRHRRRLPRLGQCRHQQGKDRPPVVCRPRPHRERALPAENLFYNTTAPGIVLFLNKAKPKERKGKVFLVNASQVFAKGEPKNFIPTKHSAHRDTLIGWKEEEKLSRIVDHAELKKTTTTYPPAATSTRATLKPTGPIAEIVEELKVIEAEARETDKA